MDSNSKKNVLQTLKVTEKSELLAFLIEKQVRKSRNAVKSLLVHKQVRVNNKIVSQHNFGLSAEDIVTIHKKSPKHDVKNLKGVIVIYEDEHLLVVDKESGLLSIATDREKTETAYSKVTAYLRLKDKNARIYVLHRLDREVSGLMIYAKTPEIQAMMQKNWNNFVKFQSYTAVVEGELEPADGTIVSWLTEDKNYVMRSSPKDNGGQKSVTRYTTISTDKKFSMLKFELETSRKNQIRVHMQSVGHPIVGDKKYGSKINPVKRIALHAGELFVVHPYTNEILELKSPVPKKIQVLLQPVR